MPDALAAHIANELGIADLPPEEQETLIGQFGEVALQAATLSILGKLSEGAREEFAKLSEAGDVVALKAFLDREVPDHDTIRAQAVAEEVKRFKNFQTA